MLVYVRHIGLPLSTHILWTTSLPYFIAGSKAEKEVGHALKLAISEMAKIGPHGTHVCVLDKQLRSPC